MIAAAQKVEHYEIAAYGTMRTWANLLGRSEIAGIFEQTLDEEKETDQKLTEIAERTVNAEAAEGENDEAAMSAGRRGAAPRGRRETQGRGRSTSRAAAAERSGRRRR
jgi:hypothetical protein